MKTFTTYSSPVGILYIAERDGFLTELLTSPIYGAEPGDTPLLRKTAAALDAYFAGALREFDLPLAPEGTAFRLRVWGALCDIPYGKTRTYAELARAVGNPRASRAVGQANHHNPLCILIPCHRVVGADGSLTGYGGGLPMKRFLLELEGSL